MAARARDIAPHVNFLATIRECAARGSIQPEHQLLSLCEHELQRRGALITELVALLNEVEHEGQWTADWIYRVRNALVMAKAMKLGNGDAG